MSKKKAVSKLGIAPSLKAAASVCGISLRAVQAAKNEGCPAIQPSGRVNCDALMLWIQEHPEALALAGQALSKDEETVLKLRAERLLKEHSLACKRNEFVPVADAAKAIGDMIGEAKKVLLPGPASLAPQVVGVSIPEAEKLLNEWLHDALSRLSQNPLGIIEPAPAPAPAEQPEPQPIEAAAQ